MTARLLKQTLVSAALITVGGNVLGRLFGYLREAVVAGYFGTSAVLDVFLVAFIIPEIITFVVFAALPTTVIQAAATIDPQDRARESSLFRRGFAACAGIMFVGTAALVLLRHEVIFWTAPELAPESAGMGAHLLGILALVIFFRGLEAYFRAWLFRKKHFVAPAMSPLVLNGVLIAAILLGYGTLDIDALAYGWLAASVLLCVWQAGMAWAIVKPVRTERGAGAPVGPLIKLTLAVAAIEAAFLFFPAIDRFLAVRYLGEGEIAALRYALFLSQVPPGMLVVTFSAAAFPWISDMAAAEPARLISFYRETVRLILFVMAPVAAGLILFAPQVVTVAFRRGAFDQTSVLLTTGPLVCYALGLLFYGVYFYQVRFYYAKNLLARLGVILGLTLLLKLAVSIALVRWLAADGLALATSLAWLASAVIMTVDLGRKSSLTLSHEMPGWLLRMIISTLGACVVWIGVRELWLPPADTSLTAQFAWLLGIGLVGAVVYIGIASALKLPEPGRLIETITSRLARR